MTTTCITYADLFKPSGRVSSTAYDTMLVLTGSILIAVSAKIAFPIPFSPVPVTGQTFAVLLLGALLGSRRGILAVLAYIAEGISGMPVFTGAGAGFAYLVGPTGGYIAGFAAAAGITGLLAEKGWDRNVLTTAIAMAAGSAAIYLFGVTWLSLFAGGKAVSLGLIPFIPGDIVKIVLAAIILPAGWKLIRR